MRVDLTPTRATLTGRIAPPVYGAVRRALRYTKATYGWLPAQRRSGWSSVTVDLAATAGAALVFPAGLWHRVARLLPEAEVVYTPPRLPVPTPVTTLRDGTTLYPDQVTALQIAVTEQRGLLALATNFGKTELMAALLLSWPGAPALVLVDQKALVHQHVDRLTTLLGEPVRAVGGGSVDRRPARITVASVQTLYKRREHPEVRALLTARLVLADEVHRVSPTWLVLLAQLEQAVVRLGLSGTIKEVAHKLPMEAYFGPVLHTVEDATLIASGRSAAVTVLMPMIEHAVQIGDYDQRLYDATIAGDPHRNQTLAQFAVACAEIGLATLVYFYRVEHGRTLERLVQDRYGGSVVRLDGGSAPTAVHAGLARAAGGEPGVYLLGTGFTQGVNLPGVRAMINAAGWRSPLMTSQRGGRPLRKKADGNWAYIIDPMDQGLKLNVPTPGRMPQVTVRSTLENQAQDREATYRQKGFVVHVGTPGDLLERIYQSGVAV